VASRSLRSNFARVLGARVIATTSTADKAARLKALGASDVINYTETPDWDETARELTDGRGVDRVVERRPCFNGPHYLS
jgi:NADPH:quinone reductase-like Zn-dependent oxidoreductase